jgi:hypothetical protein
METRLTELKRLLQPSSSRHERPLTIQEILQSVATLSVATNEQITDPLARIHSGHDFLSSFTVEQQQLILGLYHHHFKNREQDNPLKPAAVQTHGKKRRAEGADEDNEGIEKKRKPNKRLRRTIVESDSEEPIMEQKGEQKQDAPIARKEQTVFLEEASDDDDDSDTELENTKKKYKRIVFKNRLLEIGCYVTVDLADSVADQVALGRVYRIYHEEKKDRIDVTIQWCYHSADLPQHVRKLAKEGFDMIDGDYCLSTAYQQLSSDAILDIFANGQQFMDHYQDGMLHDETFIFDVDSSEMRNGDGDYSANSNNKDDAEIGSLSDCLAAAPAYRELTTFWKRINDILLQPNKELGTVSNPRRQVFEQCRYKLTFERLPRADLGECYCCGLPRQRTYEMTFEHDGTVQLIGAICQERLHRLSTFYHIMDNAVHEFDTCNGKMSVQRLVALRLRIRALVEEFSFSA